MKFVIITGSCGLVGAEAVKFFHKKNFKVIGIDNDFRKKFFGSAASVDWSRKFLIKNYKNYYHYNININSKKKLKLFLKNIKKKLNVLLIVLHNHLMIGLTRIL